jgi:hypothetical protein
MSSLPTWLTCIFDAYSHHQGEGTRFEASKKKIYSKIVVLHRCISIFCNACGYDAFVQITITNHLIYCSTLGIDMLNSYLIIIFYFNSKNR